MTEKKQIELSIFDAIKQHPKYHQDRSVQWFKDRIIEFRKANIGVMDNTLLAVTKKNQSSRLLPGTLNLFKYDPKYKETLPFYDMFPLSFVFDIQKDHFIGINFHYLPIPIRVKLYDKMNAIAKNNFLPSQQVMALNWKLLSAVSKFPEVRPAVKKYLFGHVKSKFIKLNIDDWKTAIMLPNESFMKSNVSSVYKDSLNKIADLLKP